MVSCTSRLIRLQDFVIVNVSGKNQLVISSFSIFYLVYSIKLNGTPFSNDLLSILLSFIAFILSSLENDFQVISTAVLLSSISCSVRILVVEILQEGSCACR